MNETCTDIYEFVTNDVFDNVFPCEILRYNLGNAREKSLKEIYQGKEFEEFTKKYCIIPNHLEICRYCVASVHNTLGGYFA